MKNMAKILYSNQYENWFLIALLFVLIALFFSVITTAIGVAAGVDRGDYLFYACFAFSSFMLGTLYANLITKVGMYDRYPVLAGGKPTRTMVGAGYWIELSPLFEFERKERISTERQTTDTPIFTPVATDAEMEAQFRIIWKPKGSVNFTKSTKSAFENALKGRIENDAGDLVQANSYFETGSILRVQRKKFIEALLVDKDLIAFANSFDVKILDVQILKLDALNEEDRQATSVQARTSREIAAAAEKVAGANAAIKKVMADHPGMTFAEAQDLWEMSTGKDKKKIKYEGLDKTNTVNINKLV